MIILKPLKLLVGYMALGLVVTNCSVNQKITEPAQTAILPTNLGSQILTTLEPTVTIMNLPTDSVEPNRASSTSIKGSIKTSAPIYTNVPISTMTSSPTPDTQTRENMWREIMATPTCTLPCWWGIKPGMTSWIEAQNLLKPLVIYPGSYPVSDGSVKHDATFHFFESRIFNELGLVEKKDIIETIQVQGEGLENPEDFREIWKVYTPELILQEFGLPSRISLQTWQHYVQPSDPTYRYYDLSLFYDHLGFAIIYRGRIENKPNYMVCPTYTGNLLEEIYIYTRSPTSQVPLENIIGEQGGARESAYSLQDASGLTTQQFSDLITKNQGSACFDTKADIWPR
jgi:hypothetical protein